MTRRFSILMLCSLLGLLAGCGSNPPEKSGQSASKPVVPVASAATTANPDDDGILASGPLVVENQVEIEAQREGMVAKVIADTGTIVKAGQLLGTLDDRQALADRDAAAARVKSLEYDVKGWEYETKVLEADYERAQKMWEAQLITKQDLDHARYKVEADKYETERYRANLESAKEQLRVAELELGKTKITAPFAGVVGRRYVRMGDKVTAGEKLFWVTATSPLRVRFTLPERYVGKIHKGDMLAVNVPDAAEMKHAAKVIIVSPVVDPASGTIEVSAEVVPPLGELRPGMSANISLKK